MNEGRRLVGHRWFPMGGGGRLPVHQEPKSPTQREELISAVVADDLHDVDACNRIERFCLTFPRDDDKLGMLLSFR
jgi:hypothetical protein